MLDLQICMIKDSALLEQKSHGHAVRTSKASPAAHIYVSLKISNFLSDIDYNPKLFVGLWIDFEGWWLQSPAVHALPKTLYISQVFFMWESMSFLLVTMSPFMTMPWQPDTGTMAWYTNMLHVWVLCLEPCIYTDISPRYYYLYMLMRLELRSWDFDRL